MIDYNRCPESVRDTLKRYIENGVPTGGFCKAVLSNDLFAAFGRADDINRFQLFEIVSFIHNYAPIGCHGSPDAYLNWLKSGGLAAEA